MAESARPRVRDPPPLSQTRRRSIADRLLGSFNQARGESIKRRASSSSSSSTPRQSPVPRIRAWLEGCNSGHGLHCCRPDGRPASSWSPPRLIDVLDRRLVRAQPTDRYLALSYLARRPLPPRESVGPTARLLTSNLEAYQLALPEEDIPKTILDAIWLSKKLGIRHLWVDRFCILHDDDADRNDHIGHMAFVFANAYLTLAAVHGHLDTGLVSLDPRRPLRSTNPPSLLHDDLLLASSYSTRAWTLQELLYSRRVLFLFEDTVSWECHCLLWQGEAKPTSRKRHQCPNPLFPADLGFRHPPWPDLDQYARIAMEYSTRRLNSVDDTLDAFAGITHLLSSVFSGGFAYGMPLMFLDLAMLWRPQATIRRRAPSRPPFLPSWSWMGWWLDGIPVDLTLWRAGADYVEETPTAKRGLVSGRFQAPYSFRIRPTISWRLTDRARSTAVANNGLRHRELRLRKHAAASLPPGWSRKGDHFKHESDPYTIFKYPVPVLDEAARVEVESAARERTVLGPLLSFKTTVGFFDVDYAISMVPRDKPNPPVAVGNIWGRAGRWVGEFRSHDGWLGVQSSNYEGEERLEFIAISKAIERRGSYVFPEERFRENMSAGEVVGIVNVLWIERIGGVAYRRGIGHILDDAWEEQAQDEAEVLLG